MADKEYVKDLGAGLVTAIRPTSKWRNYGCIVILDSAFASWKAVKALAGVGLLMIGNVKTAHIGLPKQWLNCKVSRCAGMCYAFRYIQWLTVGCPRGH